MTEAALSDYCSELLESVGLKANGSLKNVA
jgi:hypothetical protein